MAGVFDEVEGDLVAGGGDEIVAEGLRLLGDFLDLGADVVDAIGAVGGGADHQYASSWSICTANSVAYSLTVKLR